LRTNRGHRRPACVQGRRRRGGRAAHRGAALTERETPGGRLYAGTSGFAYPAWSPRFYPPSLRPAEHLSFYAGRLTACELNNTFYQQPTEPKVRAWLAATPDTFRFAVKAQRGGAMRALLRDPAGSVPWLTAPLTWFGTRLGSVLYRVPGEVRLDLGRLQALLAAWPAAIPLTMEFQDPSWHVDEVFTALRDAGAALCATELPEDAVSPDLRLTGPFLYLRLRRHDYTLEAIAAWAARLVPFLHSGIDAFAFFRHDDEGRATEYAAALDRAVAELR
jgi:uncharacterized protein YecE (DUF72 family)